MTDFVPTVSVSHSNYTAKCGLGTFSLHCMVSPHNPSNRNSKFDFTEKNWKLQTFIKCSTRNGALAPPDKAPDTRETTLGLNTSHYLILQKQGSDRFISGLVQFHKPTCQELLVDCHKREVWKLYHGIKGFACLHIWSQSRHLTLVCITLYTWFQGSLKVTYLSSTFHSLTLIWLEFRGAHPCRWADCISSYLTRPISQTGSFWQQHYSLMTQYFLWLSHFSEVWRNFCKLIIDVRTDYTSSFIRREMNNPEVVALFTLTDR